MGHYHTFRGMPDSELSTNSKVALAVSVTVVILIILYLAVWRKDAERRLFVPSPALDAAPDAAPDAGGAGPGSQGSGRNWHLDKNSHTITADGRLVHTGDEAILSAYERLFGES